MGWCRDFGAQIEDGCTHRMEAGASSCTCPDCGVVCTGRFGGCPEVWARGPVPVPLINAPADPLESAGGAAGTVPTGASASKPQAVPGNGRQPGVAEGTVHLEEAMASLRHELHGLRGAMSRQQEMVDGALGNGRSPSAPDLEPVRAIVETAVQHAVDGLRRDIESVSESHGRELAAVREKVDGLHQQLESATRAAQTQVEREPLEAVTEVAERLSSELARREANSRKAFRAMLDEELRPLVDVMAESIAQSDVELKALGDRLDRLEESGASTLDALARLEAMVEVLTENVERLADPRPREASTPAGDGDLPLFERARTRRQMPPTGGGEKPGPKPAATRISLPR